MWQNKSWMSGKANKMAICSKSTGFEYMFNFNKIDWRLMILKLYCDLGETGGHGVLRKYFVPSDLIWLLYLKYKLVVIPGHHRQMFGHVLSGAGIVNITVNPGWGGLDSYSSWYNFSEYSLKKTTAKNKTKTKKQHNTLSPVKLLINKVNIIDHPQPRYGTSGRRWMDYRSYC